MIIGISGKIGSGKDTVGKIIQYLISNNKDDVARHDNTYHPSSIEDFNAFCKCDTYNHSNWQIVKFADALKDIACILTGCTREQLEDQEFKSRSLPKEWIRYGYADGFYKYYKNGKEETMMNNVQCDKERYDLEYRTNWQTAYKVHPTYRELLQYLGTDLLRNKLHNDVWVNALMSKYYGLSNNTHGRVGKEIPDGYEYEDISGIKHKVIYPNWIITDVRFPNELKAIKDRDGITIRVERDSTVYHKYTDKDVIEKLSSFGYKLTDIDFSEIAINEGFKYSKSLNLWSFDEEVIPEHTSEKALDNAKFNYTIDNNDTIEELIENVKQILIKENLYECIS